MKRIQILITALVALCATSCVEGYEDTGFTPLDPVLSFEKSNLDANSSAQELTIKFSSNLPWMITSDASWMSATPSRGEAGENIEITVNLQRNRTVEVREGNLIASITKDNPTFKNVPFVYLRKKNCGNTMVTTPISNGINASKNMPKPSVKI